MLRLVLALAGALSGSAALAASPTLVEDAKVLTSQAPDGQFVVVAEGPKEAASVGSYAVRLYRMTSREFPTDDFVTGQVLPRDGTLQRLDWSALAPGGETLLIVVTRSAGSGSWISADAFAVGQGTLRRVATVSGIDPGADLKAALGASLAAGSGGPR